MRANLAAIRVFGCLELQIARFARMVRSHKIRDLKKVARSDRAAQYLSHLASSAAAFVHHDTILHGLCQM
jgi:hypothetical protein